MKATKRKKKNRSRTLKRLKSLQNRIRRLDLEKNHTISAINRLEAERRMLKGLR